MNSIIGLDIGYSNIKLVLGDENETPATKIYPAGAAPAEHIANSIIPGQQNTGIAVNVDSKKYIAGFQQSGTSQWTRVLDTNYSRTDDYKALFLASLLYSERDVIDMLVTGLPTYQCLDEKRVNEIKEMMLGEHQITNKRKVTVKNVSVYPQPVGAYIDSHTSSAEKTTLEKGKVLVIDPGFFSVDWVLINSGEIEMSSSSSSTQAVSIILDDTANVIFEDYGARPLIEDLEKSIRDQSFEILVLGKKVKITDYIDQASSRATSSVMREINNKLRQVDTKPDLILLAGGGAEMYKKAIEEAFKTSPVLIPEESVFANARGYWQLGRAA